MKRVTEMNGLPKRDLQLAPMHRILKRGGADRVSDSGARQLQEALEEIGLKIAEEAWDYAVHARRKTVKAEDIKLAVKKLF